MPVCLLNLQLPEVVLSNAKLTFNVALGSWADEMEDMPMPCKYQENFQLLDGCR